MAARFVAQAVTTTRDSFCRCGGDSASRRYRDAKPPAIPNRQDANPKRRDAKPRWQNWNAETPARRVIHQQVNSRAMTLQKESHSAENHQHMFHGRAAGRTRIDQGRRHQEIRRPGLRRGHSRGFSHLINGLGRLGTNEIGSLNTLATRFIGR